MASLYGSGSSTGRYGTGVYGGLPSEYLSSKVFFTTVYATKYLDSTALLQTNAAQYLQSRAFAQPKRLQYLDSTAYLVYTRKQYVDSTAALQSVNQQYLDSKVNLSVQLFAYEVDEFQVIVDKQFVKFYWKDSSPGTNKIYTIYDSIDSGVTWNLIITTTTLTYQLNTIPFDIPSRIYRIRITAGAQVSYGFLSYPTFSFRKVLNALDNGYWDTDPNSNVYMLNEGISKETHNRAELELKYTQQDESILRIRNSRISDVYGVDFNQQTTTVNEDYRRKIWNLFLGFRNSMTFEGVYDVVKAFTHIPPRIKKMSTDAWVLGRRYLGENTIPQSNLTALYGVKFEVHLYKQAVGGVARVLDSTTLYDTTSISGNPFTQINNYYKNKYLVFNTGANSYKSRRIAASTLISDTTTRFATDAFSFNTTASDTFFVTDVSTNVIEQYIKMVIPLHSSTLFLYFSDYATENQTTGFSGGVGTTTNTEKIASERLKVLNINNTVDDEGKQVQAKYESGFVFSNAYPLNVFGGNGVVCWDDILWGGSNATFNMYVSYTSNITAPSWSYASGVTNYVTLNGLQEANLIEYIVPNSEIVADTTGGVTRTRGVDYVMDYRNGTIRRTVVSSIPSGSVLAVRYNMEWGRVTQNQSLSFGAGKNYIKYKWIINGLIDKDDFEFSGFYLKKLP